MKLHYHSLVSNNRPDAVIDLDSQDDFDAIVERFPQLEESMHKYNDLRLIAKDMADYLSSHHMHAWVTD